MMSNSDVLGILEALPIWLNTDAGRILADLTVDCISTLRQQVGFSINSLLMGLVLMTSREGCDAWV